MPEVTVSLIIVSYNTRDLLAQCLRSIATHAPHAEVVVVDNASRDGSAEMVRSEFPGVKLLALAGNGGFAAANNAGLPLCRGEFVVLLNSDTVLEDDGLDRCAALMRRSPKLGAVSPRLVGFDGRDQQCLHDPPSLRRALRVAARLSPTRGGEGPAREPWLAGTALMVRREAIDGLDGFLDDSYFMYWEDADLSARLRADGWELATCAEAHVRHHGGASGGGADESRRGPLFAWYVYGKHRWFAKHRPAWEAAGLWLLDLVEVPRMLARGALRPGRRHEISRSRTLAGVLGRRLVGLAPGRPAGSSAVATPRGLAP